MTILQINCVYKTGSTGKIVADLHSYYSKKGHKSFVCYGRGERIKEKNIFKVSSEFEAKIHSVLSKLFGVDFGFSNFSTSKTIRLIKTIKPNVVHLHCLNGHFINVYKLISFLKKNKIKTVLTLHAELMHTAGCEHAFDCLKWTETCYKCQKIKGLISSLFRDDAKHCFNAMKRAMDGFDELVVVGVSEWLTKRANRSPIFANMSFKTINNGLDTSIFKYTPSCKCKDNQFKGNIVHVTPDFNHPIKGGKYVLELAKAMPDYRFLIVGYNGSEELPKNVFAIKKTNNQHDLANYYSSADVTILTSSRETFSMVVAESLCCGTPVVGFEAGGPESISIPKYSFFVKQGDIVSLKKAILSCLNSSFNKDEISICAKDKYSREEMCEKYLDLYQSIL